MSDSESRIFVGSAVALAVPVWNTAFNVGVYGTVFYETAFLVWVVATATFAATLFLPAERIPISTGGKLIMALPTVLLVLRLMDDQASADDLGDTLLQVVAVATVVLSLPYTLYAVVLATSPELENLRTRRYQLALFGIVVGIGAVGYFVGLRNELFLTCWDFQVSGNDLPARCR